MKRYMIVRSKHGSIAAGRRVRLEQKNDKPHQLNVVVVNRSAENEESLSSVTGTLTSGTSTSSESVTKKAKHVHKTGATGCVVIVALSH